MIDAVSAFGRAIYKDPADPVMAAFLGGLSIYSLSFELSKKKALPAHKVDEIWLANREIALAGLNTVSTGANFTTWLDKVKFIQLDSFAPLNNALGWIGGGVSSSVRAWETLQEFDKGIFEYDAMTHPGSRREVAMQQMERLLRGAYLVCFAAWGILNTVHAFTSGITLFYIADQFFACGLVCFIANLATILFFQYKHEQSPQKT